VTSPVLTGTATAGDRVRAGPAPRPAAATGTAAAAVPDAVPDLANSLLELLFG
jgi:hypothetical protein